MVAILEELGIKNIHSLNKNYGLARAFSVGINKAMELGADIIVNTDADLSNEIFDYAISFSDRYDEDNIEVVTNTRWI